MERDFVTPKVVISKCLTFAKCRYNGDIINDDFIKQLKGQIDFITVCPEVEIGLGVPRDSIRLVKKEGEVRLIQSATDKDVTVEMKGFAADFFASLSEVDGFILKNRSPSCGSRDAKVYDKNGVPSQKDSGLFGGLVKEEYPTKAITNEGRLKNFKLREHFLTKLYTLADFRKLKENPSMGQLVNFQSRNKLLFLSYNEVEMRKLGQITANHEGQDLDTVLDNYEQHLSKVFAKPPTYTANINVLTHAFGYVSNDLSKSEKNFFFDKLEQYRNGKVPLSVPNSILSAWILRNKVDYLKQQTFFAPYPKELIEIKDSGTAYKRN
ncbi:MAG: YbgA family protein [Bacillota bacterium]